jgi:hypothetical protein
MNAAAVGSHPATWTRSRWLMICALVFAAHLGFIFAFGERKPIAPRAVTNVLTLQLADDTGELLALNDPTLFALPNPKDSASSVWRKMPDVPLPSFRYRESPRWLPLAAENLGAAFSQFMQTNYFARYPLEFKPPPKLSAPALLVQSALAQISTLQIEGELAPRRLLNEINLPSLPYNDVIALSRVQVLVDTAGNVISTVLLPSENSLEAAGRYDAADQRALVLARTVRFAPSTHLTFGRLIFNWHTVPVSATNAPDISP